MSKEWILKTLISLGFTDTNAKVYIYLASKGPQDVKNIAQTLKIPEQRLELELRKLQQKRLIEVNPKIPNQFSAILLSKILDNLINSDLKKAEQLEEKKNKHSLNGTCSQKVTMQTINHENIFL